MPPRRSPACIPSVASASLARSPTPRCSSPAPATSPAWWSTSTEATRMAGEPAPRYVVVYGAQVDDPATYGRYRAAMTPILHAHGGNFRYDFEVSRVLISET